jgi:hypothetical protein
LLFIRSILSIFPIAVVFLTLSILVRKGAKEISFSLARRLPIEMTNIPVTRLKVGNKNYC